MEYLDNETHVHKYIIVKDYEVRRLLHKKFLYSSAIIIGQKPESGVPNEFIFTGAGWGHGAGMCQIGGLGMSLAGYPAEEILYHYYPGTELKRIYL